MSGLGPDDGDDPHTTPEEMSEITKAITEAIVGKRIARRMERDEESKARLERTVIEQHRAAARQEKRAEAWKELALARGAIDLDLVRRDDWQPAGCVERIQAAEDRIHALGEDPDGKP